MSLVIENHRVKNVVLNNKFVRGNSSVKLIQKFSWYLRLRKGVFPFKVLDLKTLKTFFKIAFEFIYIDY